MIYHSSNLTVEIVNTRSLFYKLDTQDYKELSKEDCMALCPFIDYFNHSDDGVSSPGKEGILNPIRHPNLL